MLHLLGSPRVHGDEEEEGSDDIESEFASSIAGRSNTVHPYRVSVPESSINSWDIDSVSITNSGASVHFYEEVTNLKIPNLSATDSCYTGTKVMSLLLQHVGTPTNHHALVMHPNTGEIVRYNPCMLPFQLVLL